MSANQASKGASAERSSTLSCAAPPVVTARPQLVERVADHRLESVREISNGLVGILMRHGSLGKKVSGRGDFGSR